MLSIKQFATSVSTLEIGRVAGQVLGIGGGVIRIGGLLGIARVGDLVNVERPGADVLTGEIVALDNGIVSAMAYGPLEGVREGDPVVLTTAPKFCPDESWLGEVIDAFGKRLDGKDLYSGSTPQILQASPPAATERRRIGQRLPTGLAVLDTMLPVVAGQRVGLFAGSGVGKSRLLARLARSMAADIVVVGLIGERGREVREFVEETLGEEGMRRSCVIAATSDQPAAVKRRAAWATLATAEYFRDSGKNVLLLFDSVTRFAEAHREIALTAGEAPSLRGFPPSTTPLIASLVERSGPGPLSSGADITAVFTVLVAGSDMDEPVADIVRGVLDGHVILDRTIAERGRFPAIDVRRSVSRSLPDAATADENVLIGQARSVFGRYEEVLPMLQVGLYRAGGDVETDNAVKIWPTLDRFVAEDSTCPEQAFARLAEILSSANYNDELKSESDAEGPNPDDD